MQESIQEPTTGQRPVGQQATQESAAHQQSTEGQTTQSMHRHSMGDDENLVNLWEQMGTSTGSLLGKFIGLTFQYGLQTYQQAVISPLQQVSQNFTAPPSEHGIPSDVREQTWGQMGREYGEYLGKSIGMTMDLLIKSLESAVSTTGVNTPESK